VQRDFARGHPAGTLTCARCPRVTVTFEAGGAGAYPQRVWLARRADVSFSQEPQDSSLATAFWAAVRASISERAERLVDTLYIRGPVLTVSENGNICLSRERPC
jgi:hypothetical protein